MRSASSSLRTPRAGSRPARSRRCPAGVGANSAVLKHRCREGGGQSATIGWCRLFSFESIDRPRQKVAGYGNRTPVARDQAAPVNDTDWLFEVVLDDGEHDPAAPTRRRRWRGRCGRTVRSTAVQSRAI
jgi:hypothetical protein